MLPCPLESTVKPAPYIGILLLTLSLLSCATIDQPLVYRRTLQSTVRIDSTTSIGSGVVINDHCVVTAKHIAADPTPQTITTQDGKVHKVTLKYLHPYSDLGVDCTADSLAAPPIHIRHTMPGLFTPVFVIGNPIGINNTLTTGEYEGDDRISAPIVWGNSGGGAFDPAGNLIGVVVAMAAKRIENYVFVFPHLGVITTIRDIVPFLDANHIPYQQAQE